MIIDLIHLRWKESKSFLILNLYEILLTSNKVAKAKKSTHKRGKTVKAIRGKVISAPVTTTSRYDPTQEWEIAVSIVLQ